MRVMVLVKANEQSEAGVLPDAKLLADMGKFNEELVKAGVMLAGEGLQPSSKGGRVRFDGPKRTVIDGPFSETKELIAGFWLWQCKSLAEAIEWAKLSEPDGRIQRLEIRQVFEAEDFGAEFTPELREQEERVSRAGRASRVRFACATRSCCDRRKHMASDDHDIRDRSTRSGGSSLPLIASLARIVRGDVGLAEELAQDALVAALEQWPTSGVPEKPGAWLMSIAKRRAIDHIRRNKMLDRTHDALARSAKPIATIRSSDSTRASTTPSATTCYDWCS